MLIHETSRRTGLTKKAIEYYASQGLLSPAILDNGYRAYSEADVARLNKIRVLRALAVSTEEIGRILDDTTNSALQAAALKRELDCRRSARKNAILQRLGEGRSYEEASGALQTLEREKSITDKLLDAFPGYYGRFICLHFARFLDEPIQSAAQQAAYETVLSFLDNAPAVDMPAELQAYLAENTQDISVRQIAQTLAATRAAYEDPDAFLAANKEALESYWAFKQSDAYKNSPACKWMEWMRAFNSTSGYNDVFLPAMKRLSPSYAAYCQDMEAANEKLLRQYPELERMNDGIK